METYVRQGKKYATDALIIVGILCVLVLTIYAGKGIYPFGSRMMMWGDLTQQGIPWLYDAYDVFTGAADSGFTWRYSGGLEGNASWIANLFDFPVIFSERANLYQFFSVLLLFKMCCMGVAMYFFACRYDVHRGLKILTGVLYGMCSCVLVHYQIGYVMLDMAILFPVLMVGFYLLMEKDQPFLYLVMLAFCIYKNTYVSFMICMYLFPLGLFYLLFCAERKEAARKCRNLVISSLLAIGCSSPSWFSMISSLGDSNRLAMSGGGSPSGLFSMYWNVIAGENGGFHVPDFLMVSCLLMGHGWMFSSVFLSWKKMTGVLRYHKAQLILLLCAMFLPGTELLWHGGSHFMWPVRFAFIVTFALLEICLVLRQQGILCVVGCAGQKFFVSSDGRGLFSAIFFLAVATVFHIWLSLRFTDYWISLLAVSTFCFLLWTVFYKYALHHSFPQRNVLILAALVMELGCNGWNWLAPDFVKMSSSPLQVTPDWNTQEYNQYFLTTEALFREISHQGKSPLDRTRDVFHSFNSNYAAMTGTCSISNYRGNIPSRIQDQYAALGYGTEGVRVLDSGGTLFSDALLHVTSVFTTEQELSREFYQEDPSVSAVHWYHCRYELPVGIEIRQDALPSREVFAYQNHVFHAITGRGDDLIEIYQGGLDRERIEIPVRGRKELYFYGDFVYHGDRSAEIGEIRVNGNIFQIPNLTEMRNTAYPAEFNSRLLDLGTFEDEIVVLELEKNKEVDASKLHVGLLDLGKMSEAFRRIREKNHVSEAEIGPLSLSLHQESERGGILFLPVNFYPAWKCEVNGQLVALESVFGGFVGIPVSQGSNEIRMEYRKELPRGVLVLVWGSALLSAMWLLFQLRGIGKLSYGVPDLLITAVYAGTAFLLLLAAYLVPALSLAVRILF